MYNSNFIDGSNNFILSLHKHRTQSIEPNTTNKELYFPRGLYKGWGFLAFIKRILISIKSELSQCLAIKKLCKLSLEKI